MSRQPTRRTALAAGTGTALLGSARMTRAAQKPPAIEAYADRVSYSANDEVRIHASTAAAEFDAEIVRIGAKVEVVQKLTGLTGKLQPVPKDASARGCQWPVNFRFKIDPAWKSGYYMVRWQQQGQTLPVTWQEPGFVVRSAQPGKSSKLLLQLATNTYNAYTNWGGYSLYAYHGRHKVQGRRVSFHRPQYSQFNRWELPFVAWAESAGYALDYCANSDLEFHPDLLKSYKLMLSVGHDEYWSAAMRDTVEGYIGRGGNVAFFSGNTCCWQVRSEEEGRALTCFKQNFGDDPYYMADKHALLSTLWGHYLVKRPENELTGVGFLWGGYHRSHGQFMDGSGAFTVHRPDHWLFAGTQLKKGEAFGAVPNKYKVVGYECDGCELKWVNGLPEPTYRDGTPKSFEVLATAPAKWHPDDSEWYEQWEKGRVGNAVVGSYTRGGTVVTVGTTDWSHGLRGNDPAVIRITKNVLDKLGK